MGPFRVYPPAPVKAAACCANAPPIAQELTSERLSPVLNVSSLADAELPGKATLGADAPTVRWVISVPVALFLFDEVVVVGESGNGGRPLLTMTGTVSVSCRTRGAASGNSPAASVGDAAAPEGDASCIPTT